MQRNLSSFGTVVDSGIIKGSSGVYSGKGYVVLEQFLKTTDNTVEHRLPELQHNVRWFISRLITPCNLALLPFLQKSTLMSTPPGHQ
ncbi:hypothetical protein G6F57_023482 [Rhizopus arrhizus]|nr:hypothetical protein G6F22_017917 [Rhizopus arrhizus]KAG0803438.1 hypothetical protein G6F18_014317 [Rhizopus arrhizus]KAG0882366.1 hypothetical protein G6F33_014309 [Rhizopus arrhizus]KAG0963442.1 hypothetical protein G6F29_014387 [Rhizopus arrhizus]KAG1004135.1 hypothetical protein G6F25_014420 [Rhizopus arrhizus]